MAISAIYGTAAALPGLPAKAPNSVREAALERQIAAKISEAECTQCKDTAAKANKDADNLRAELAALKAEDTQGVSATPASSNFSSPAVEAESNPGPSKSGDPYGRSVAQGKAEVDYRPIAVRASPAVQIALSDLNSEQRLS
jgi:hypothetical protein